MTSPSARFGSGSALIAAEKTGRVCRGVEGQLGRHLDGEGHGRAVHRGDKLWPRNRAAPKQRYGLLVTGRIPESLAQTNLGSRRDLLATVYSPQMGDEASALA